MFHGGVLFAAILPHTLHTRGMALHRSHWSPTFRIGINPGGKALHAFKETLLLDEACGDSNTPAGRPFWVTTTGLPVSAARRIQSEAWDLNSLIGTKFSEPRRERMECSRIEI